MGNFYTNFVLLTTCNDRVRSILKQNNRRAYIGPEQKGICFVYDSVCDEQDLKEIETLGQQLSKELNCVILSSLNHDDDWLILRLFSKGQLVGKYNHFWDGVIVSFQLVYFFRRWLSWPFVFFSVTFPTFIFQFIRHSCLARSLGLPPWAVGLGYDYIRRNDIPYGMDQSQFELI